MARVSWPSRRRKGPLGAALLLALGLQGLNAPAQAEPVHLKIVGGLAGIQQYTGIEEPFWSREIETLSGGRIKATIHPFDRSGVPGTEMLQLMRLGVVPFGTAILSLVAGDEPELNAVDLPALNPDLATLATTVKAYRGHIAQLLRERYDIELLGIYTYPAQVLYCARPFSGLDDLSGRRIRTSSVGQSEMMTALGAFPVMTPFAETVNAVTRGTVDCAITGTLSGNEIGLFQVTTHIHGMALGWGLSFFGANRAALQALPSETREALRAAVAVLETRVWEAAGRDTVNGLACNVGMTSCVGGRRGTMTMVPPSPQDESIRRMVVADMVVPRWIERCGQSCAEAWNRQLAPIVGIRIGEKQPGNAEASHQ